jgi:hypothetical protein
MRRYRSALTASSPCTFHIPLRDQALVTAAVDAFQVRV